MCGIAGIVGGGDPGTRLDTVRMMTAALTHRGPDDEGYWADETCALGHRRLSIIDLSVNGRQPMENEDGTVHVVFNGELYDFARLRAQLEGRGHRFRSRTDTEVIVHLYEEHGEDLVRHIRGMFALAVWDSRSRKLLLARDHFGQKPLFYVLGERGIAFASEIKGLLANPATSRTPDPQAIDLFLTLHFVPSPHSFYTSIRRLPPATILTLEHGRAPRLRRFWSLDEIAPSRLTFDEALQAVDQHLTRAVREQLVADVPVGAFLSGGIDSSLIVARAVALSPDIDTFSIGYDESPLSELTHAQSVANTFRTRHHAFVMRAEDVRHPDRILELWDEPFADIAALPQVALSRTAREHVKVVLTGDGGDELFGGYEHHVVAHWMGRTAALSYLRASLARVARLAIPRDERLWRRIRTLGRGLDAVSHVGWREATAVLRATLLAEQRISLYQPGFLATLGDTDPYATLFADQAPNVPPSSVETQFRIAGDRVLADRFLHKTDIASMSVGLECRSPFLDVRLAELVTSLPREHKVKGLHGKHVLRRLLGKQVGTAISRRKKLGLSMPIDEWLKDELGPLVKETILAPRARIFAYVQQDQVARLYREHCQGRASRKRILWALLLLELWLCRPPVKRVSHRPC